MFGQGTTNPVRCVLRESEISTAYTTRNVPAFFHNRAKFPDGPPSYAVLCDLAVDCSTGKLVPVLPSMPTVQQVLGS